MQQPRIVVFRSHGNKKQVEAFKYWIDTTTIEIVYGGGKGGGKSHLGVSAIFGDAFIYPDTRYFIARKNRSDLKKHTIPSINKVFKEWGITQNDYTYNGQDFTFNLSNGSVVLLIECAYAPSDPDYSRFGSAQYTRGWIEEAGEVDIKAKNNLGASIGRWNNDKYGLKAKLLLTCNPSKNFLYTQFYIPYRKGVLPDTKKMIIALPEDNKMLEKEYIEHLNNILSENEKRRLLKGLWEFDEDKRALIPYDKIANSFTNYGVPKGKKYITIDVARLGKDSTTVWVWDGFRGKPTKLNGLRLDEIKEVVERIRIENNIPKSNVSADEGGLGVGLIDFGGYRSFNASNSAIQIEDKAQRKFRNLRAQVYFNLAKRINEDGYFLECSPEDQERISKELEWVKCTDGSLSGEIFQIISKDEIKEGLGFSPDFADALAQRELLELQTTEINYGAFEIFS